MKLEKPYQIPYRSLKAKVNENLLMAGRCISVDHLVHGSIRSIPCCFSTGEAAGTAATLASTNRIPLTGLSIEKIQGTLIRQGVKIR
jgi:hypothetical protein